MDKKYESFDLEIFQSGYEACSSGHFYGPAIRDHYLIHYVHEGEGVFKSHNKTYKLNKGDAFLIFPNEITYYEADLENPWKYSWIGFNGEKSTYFFKELNIDTKVNPILNFDFPPLCFQEIRELDMLDKTIEIKLLGLLYLMFFQLIKENERNFKKSNTNNKDYYAEKILNYLNKNYSNKITVKEICTYIGLNRTTLNSLFKEKYKKTIKNYLLEIRIKKASYYLINSELSISEISYSVGYDDVFQFSKIFKKYTGYSPRNYRIIKEKVFND